MHDEVDLVAREMLALLRARPDLRPADCSASRRTGTYLSNCWPTPARASAFRSPARAHRARDRRPARPRAARHLPPARRPGAGHRRARPRAARHAVRRSLARSTRSPREGAPAQGARLDPHLAPLRRELRAVRSSGSSLPRSRDSPIGSRVSARRRSSAAALGGLGLDFGFVSSGRRATSHPGATTCSDSTKRRGSPHRRRRGVE